MFHLRVEHQILINSCQVIISICILTHYWKRFCKPYSPVHSNKALVESLFYSGAQQTTVMLFLFSYCTNRMMDTVMLTVNT